MIRNLVDINLDFVIKCHRMHEMETDSHGDTTGHANEGICILYARLMTTSTLPFRLKYAKRNLPHNSSRATCTNVLLLGR